MGSAPEEIDKLLANLADDADGKDDPNAMVASDKVHDISQDGLEGSPIDGMIVERDVVSGNFYDDMAVLMVISPMDKLWVWGNVYEKDQAEVHLESDLGGLSSLTWTSRWKGQVEHIDDEG